MCLAMAPSAHAEYYFHFVQFDETGDEIERGTWRCADSEVSANRCTQGIMLVINGSPQPVEMRFKDDGGILRVTMAAGAWLVEAKSSKQLVFGRTNKIASSIEAWETEQRVVPDGLTRNDLVFRPGHHLLATFTLVAVRGPADLP